MDPHEYLIALRKRWILIVALGIIGGIIGAGYASTMTDVYRATSSVFVSSTKGSTTSELQQGSTFIQNQIQSFALLTTQAAVLEPVIDELGLSESPQALAKAVTAENPLNTVIIQISVTDRSPQRAALIANAVAESLGRAATDNSPVDVSGNSTVSMNVTSPATVPNFPIAPNTRLIIVTGAVIGLLAGVVYALVRELFDTRIRRERDVHVAGEPIVLGSISKRLRTEPKGLALLASPHGEAAEGFRRVRMNLEFSDVDHRIRSVTVTSALPGEGKSTLSINLALAVAERGQRVLIIDGDLRRPSIAEYCGLEGRAGLTTVLVGRAVVEEVVQSWRPNLDVLPSGAIPPSPTQLLASASMESLLAGLEAEYDFVIIDSPPLLPAADALTLAHLTDGAIVTVQYNKTRRAQLAHALTDLRAASATVLGVVISHAKPKRASAYGSPAAYTSQGGTRPAKSTKDAGTAQGEPIVVDPHTPRPPARAAAAQARTLTLVEPEQLDLATVALMDEARKRADAAAAQAGGDEDLPSDVEVEVEAEVEPDAEAEAEAEAENENDDTEAPARTDRKVITIKKPSVSRK